MASHNFRDSFKRLEKIAKGFANHRRIEILKLLERESDLSLFDISDKLGINFKTASEHVRKLAQAGLASKQYRGQTVLHKVTNLGKAILKFLNSLD